MKKSRKIISCLTAAAVCISLSGTLLPVTASSDKIVYEGYDISRAENLAENFKDATGRKNNDEEVKKCYYRMIDEIDYANLQYILAQVQYSQNMSPENLAEYTSMSILEMQCQDVMISALESAGRTQYRNLVVSLLNEGFIDDRSGDRYRLKPDTQENLEKKNELLNRYSEISSASMDISEKNLRCAEVYLDLVKFYNSLTESDEYTYFDYAYQLYCRDYTPEDIARINDTAAESACEAYEKIYSYSLSVPGNASLVFDNNMDIVEQFAYRISDELKDSAAEVIERDLYRTASGSGSEKMAYTSLLNHYDTAVIYQYLYGITGDFSTTAHEFGHFNAMRYNSLPSVYVHRHNLDLAEVQSQGLEVLYTSFYDSIFGRYGEHQRLNQAASLITSVAAGFMGNEFENYVFENADNLTPEQVVEKYDELAARYKLYRASLFEIPHFFQYPGYYISYSASALAALELWGIMYTDYDEAVRKYTDISHVSVYDGTGFSEAMESAGFDSILTPGYIGSCLSGLSEKLTSGLVCGDTDCDGVVNTSDVLSLVSAVLSPETMITDKTMSVYDINGDGRADSADVVFLRKKLLK